jgi:uncharacterized LabA/DUF88 family protein
VDRSGVFVDAGYLLARGGLVTCGTKNRGLVDCAYEQLVEELRLYTTGHGGMEHLRVYWYDAARDRIPTPDHLTIGELPYVKVRLGRMGADGKQKGVDALIYRDLMTLARERAISRAYLIAGDEDLREGVLAAQDMGVQVVLIGVAGGQSVDPSQSNDLIREADEHVVLDEEFCARFFSGGARVDLPAVEVSADAVRDAGRAMAEQWVKKATSQEIQAAAGQFQIPREIDVQLLRDSATRLGTRMVPKEFVKDLRDTFRQVVKAAAAGEADDRDSGDTG